MRVQNSGMGLVNRHTYLERYERSEILKMWVGNNGPAQKSGSLDSNSHNSSGKPEKDPSNPGFSNPK